MKIFLGIIILLLIFGMYDSKTDNERKLYKSAFVATTIIFVFVHLAEKAVLLWV